jgi:hypothetical protein
MPLNLIRPSASPQIAMHPRTTTVCGIDGLKKRSVNQQPIGVRSSPWKQIHFGKGSQRPCGVLPRLSSECFAYLAENSPCSVVVPLDDRVNGRRIRKVCVFGANSNQRPIKSKNRGVDPQQLRQSHSRRRVRRGSGSSRFSGTSRDKQWS